MSLYTTDMPASYLGRNQCYRRDHFAFVGRASWIVWKEHDRLLLDGLTLIFTQSICQEFDHQKKKKKNNNNNNKQPQHVFERWPTSRINWFHLVATGESYGKVGNSKIVIVFVYIYINWLYVRKLWLQFDKIQCSLGKLAFTWVRADKSCGVNVAMRDCESSKPNWQTTRKCSEKS